jgi:hypothetical protein
VDVEDHRWHVVDVVTVHHILKKRERQIEGGERGVGGERDNELNSIDCVSSFLVLVELCQ